MNKLNFPSYTFRLKKSGNRTLIFDQLRRKYVSLFPEELVRQNMVKFLIRERNFPSSLMANEVEIVFGEMRRRCDTVVYDSSLRPILIIEYKAPTVEITRQTFDQIAVYNTKLNVRFLLISNGLTHCFCVVDQEKNQLSFLRDIPRYEDLFLDTKKEV